MNVKSLFSCIIEDFKTNVWIRAFDFEIKF